MAKSSSLVSHIEAFVDSSRSSAHQTASVSAITSLVKNKVLTLEALVKEKELLEKMGISGLFKKISPDEAVEWSSNMRAQVNILWGIMLYERSVIEFRLSIPVWEECLMASIEKFKLVGASATDIAIMIKNHCANETAQNGLGFKIDEIVNAWNEMYDAKRWISGVPFFRLEPLFRRRAPKLHQVHK